MGYGPVGMVTTSSEGPFAGASEPYPAATGAQINGIVNGFGWDTAVTFSWGTTAAYGETASATPSTVISGNASVSATLTGLARHTTYHYRVNATSRAAKAPPTARIASSPPPTKPLWQRGREDCAPLRTRQFRSPSPPATPMAIH